MTFSIVALDPATGDLGVAVQSKFLAVGAVVPWVSAGIGAVATQSFANVRYGPEGLALMGAGLSAQHTVRLELVGPSGEHIAAPLRPVTILDEVNDGKHPAVLLLFPNYGKDAGPKPVDKGNGVWVVNVRRPVAAGDLKAELGFAITIAGMWKP